MSRRAGYRRLQSERGRKGFERKSLVRRGSELLHRLSRLVPPKLFSHLIQVGDIGEMLSIQTDTCMMDVAAYITDCG